MRDVIIIGAGPAGLQAALTLGRMHRSALIVDSGEYRNGAVLHMHNVLTNDGTPPAEFRAIARSELDEYETIDLREKRVTAVSRVAAGFEVQFDDDTVEQAPRVMLATGVTDDLPGIPGLAALWGVHAFNCPFCDGHEFAGRTVGVLGGNRAEHIVRMLRPIGADIVVFDDEMDDGQLLALEELGARVHRAAVESVAADEHGVLVVAGDAVRVDGLFVTSATARQRSPFAEQLGLRMLPSGAIEIDEFGRTSLAGVSAAGDLAHRASLPGIMAAVTLAAAAGQLAAIGIVQELAMG
ncbi:NAD(P)/FAD-dependent oxidoreductase [Microbacterium sp. NPDC055521]